MSSRIVLTLARKTSRQKLLHLYGQWRRRKEFEKRQDTSVETVMLNSAWHHALDCIIRKVHTKLALYKFIRCTKWPISTKHCPLTSVFLRPKTPLLDHNVLCRPTMIWILLYEMSILNWRYINSSDALNIFNVQILTDLRLNFLEQKLSLRLLHLQTIQGLPVDTRGTT